LPVSARLITSGHEVKYSFQKTTLRHGGR